MKGFWMLLVLAVADLVVAAELASRDERRLGFVFVLLAVVTAGLAVFAATPRRQSRQGDGGLKWLPMVNLLATFGAAAIISAAAYIAVTTTSPPVREPAHEATHQPVPTPVARTPAVVPRPTQRKGLLYKCEGSGGDLSFQSQPCPPGSRQVWVRAVTPEPEPPRRRARTATADHPRPQVTWSAEGRASEPQTGERSTACRAAREADAAYRRRPLSQVTHDGLRRHGDAIRRACS